MAMSTLELNDRRVLAALRFVDANGLQIVSRVEVAGEPPVSVRTNRRGLAVVTRARGLEAHSDAFDAPPAGPPPSDFLLDIRPFEPGLAPRRMSLSLPRDADPANADDPGSLFRPVDVELLPTPSASLSGQAAAVRVTVTRSDDGRLVEGAVVRLRITGGPRARSVTDKSGEALLIVPGLAISRPGAGATVRGDHPATITAIADPALAVFHEPGTRATASVLIDPDDIETRFGASPGPTANARVAAGRTVTAAVQWAPP